MLVLLLLIRPLSFEAYALRLLPGFRDWFVGVLRSDTGLSTWSDLVDLKCFLRSSSSSRAAISIEGG